METSKLHKETFDSMLNSISKKARNEMIELISDVCRRNSGKLEFNYTSRFIDDDGETIETVITSAKLYDDKNLYFVLCNRDEEPAFLYSMDELYNICDAISFQVLNSYTS